ncbi:hypothetical protein SNEBB_002227 [Seison nebaliae]|nr:hypothetical protein SNEBB_002227 [Seison nebaliae]
MVHKTFDQKTNVSFKTDVKEHVIPSYNQNSKNSQYIPEPGSLDVNADLPLLETVPDEIDDLTGDEDESLLNEVDPYKNDSNDPGRNLGYTGPGGFLSPPHFLHSDRVYPPYVKNHRSWGRYSEAAKRFDESISQIRNAQPGQKLPRVAIISDMDIMDKSHRESVVKPQFWKLIFDNIDQVPVDMKKVLTQTNIDFNEIDGNLEGFNEIFRMAWDTNMITSPLLLLSTFRSLLNQSDRVNYNVTIFGLAPSFFFAMHFRNVVEVVVNIFNRSSRYLMFQKAPMYKKLFDSGSVHAANQIIKHTNVNESEVRQIIPNLTFKKVGLDPAALTEQIKKSRDEKNKPLSNLRYQIRKLYDDPQGSTVHGKHVSMSELQWRRFASFVSNYKITIAGNIIDFCQSAKLEYSTILSKRSMFNKEDFFRYLMTCHPHHERLLVNMMLVLCQKAPIVDTSIQIMQFIEKFMKGLLIDDLYYSIINLTTRCYQMKGLG